MKTEDATLPVEMFNIITPLEGQLKAAVTLFEIEKDCWRMDIGLMYGGDLAGRTSFTLNGYDSAEAEAVARTIKSNAYIMKEIDEYLWGESD
jgi:hypothetical protein